MTAQPEPIAEPRVPLTKERVLRAAVEVADDGGLSALTMRNLAQTLGVEAMSLYYHVANKEAVLDGVVDVIATEINMGVADLDQPDTPDGWKKAMRQRILEARKVLLRHPWAPEVLETRTNMSPAVIKYYDGLLGIFRAGGFSYDLAHHALHALGSRAIGFTQELFDPDEADPNADTTNQMLEQMAEQLPYLVQMMKEIVHDDPDSTLGWCDDQTEFEFGLDLVLDGLDHMREPA
ncbi:MAG: TetR/AcrR family transcriptional regulator C-terminal domain-containing protein [Acidimicrobiia bacterium]